MSVLVEIEVTDCRDCPFKGSSRGQGECWEDCNHKDHGQGAYGNILWSCQEAFEKVPAWCPLGLGDQAITEEYSRGAFDVEIDGVKFLRDEEG